MLLDLHLLELDKLGAACLQVQATTRLVHAAVVRRTVRDRHEAERINRLVRLRAAAVARVRGHHHHWLHLRAARHDAAHRHQLADVLRLHVANGHRLGGGQSAEVQLAGKNRVSWTSKCK